MMWRVDADKKTMLSDEEPRPCKAIPMKNVEDIVKDISDFIQYWEIYIEDSEWWWIMLASLQEMDRVLDTCSCRLDRPPP